MSSSLRTVTLSPPDIVLLGVSVLGATEAWVHPECPHQDTQSHEGRGGQQRSPGCSGERMEAADLHRGDHRTAVCPQWSWGQRQGRGRGGCRAMGSGAGRDTPWHPEAGQKGVCSPGRQESQPRCPHWTFSLRNGPCPATCHSPWPSAQVPWPWGPLQRCQSPPESLLAVPAQLHH